MRIKSSAQCARKSTNTPNHLQPGNLALVYDVISARHEQYQIADVVERDGKTRVRLVGFNFYMSANLIKEVRANG